MNGARPGLRPSLLAVTGLIVAAVALPVFAGERADVLALRATDLEARERCEELIALSEKSAGAADGRVALSAGRCQIRRQDYPAAISNLTVASARAETRGVRGEVQLQLGVAHYHLGELDLARASFGTARAAGLDDPLLDLYDGLLLLQANEARKAALSLERARRADARAVEPVASYYAFLAWRSLKDEKRARAALERVRASDSEGPWIAEAERLLAETKTQRDVWVGAVLGMEYDSNVVLKGNGVDIVLSPDGN